MSSRIVELRDNIIAEFKARIPQLNSVDWWDGEFDRKDLERWVTKTPAAMVTILKGTSEPLQTGEVHFPMRIVVSVIASDAQNKRDSDGQVWEIAEQMATIVPWNKFGCVNSAPALGPRIERVADPELRREGTAIIMVEWEQTMTLGRDSAEDYSYFHDQYGQRITQVPNAVTTTYHIDHLVGQDPSEIVTSESLDDATFTPRPVTKVVFPPSF